MPRPRKYFTKEEKRTANNQASARYRARNLNKRRACVRMSQAKSRKNHPEKHRAAKHDYNSTHSEQRSASRRRYYLAHYEEELAYAREYITQHPEKNRANIKKYRALKKGAAVNDLTHEQWLEIQQAQDHRCYYCGKRRKAKLTQDHITPLTKGGNHTVHNVIAACHECNSRKGNRGVPLPVQPFLLTVAPTKKKALSP